MKSVVSVFVLCLSLFGFSASAEFATVTSSKKVDLLFVIDNSLSMGSYLQKLPENLPGILENYRDTSIHVGIISSALEQENPAFLGPRRTGTFDEIVGEIARDLKLELVGHSYEKFFEPIIWSLTSPLNAGFVRPDSKLVIVIVTDADEQSDMSGEDFLTALNWIKRLQDIETYTFRALSPGCALDNPNPSRAPNPYRKFDPVLQTLRAKSFDLCGDWSTYKLN